MTLTDAIATLRAAGAISRKEDRIRIRLPKKRPRRVERALSVVQDRPWEAITLLGSEPEYRQSAEPSGAAFESVLKGHAIGLFYNELDQTLRLVSDEEDARLGGERRSLVYSTEQIRLVVSVKDPPIVRNVHALRGEFDVAARPVNDSTE